MGIEKDPHIKELMTRIAEQILAGEYVVTSIEWSPAGYRGVAVMLGGQPDLDVEIPATGRCKTDK